MLMLQALPTIATSAIMATDMVMVTVMEGKRKTRINTLTITRMIVISNDSNINKKTGAIRFFC